MKFALVAVMAQCAAAMTVVGPHPETLSINGKQIEVEVFSPAAPGRYPAVVVLHGADGIAPHAESYRTSAQELAAQGYVVVFPHYFESTGTTWADPDTITRHFLEWMQALSQTVDFTISKANVETGHIGLLGVSLGASLALSEAAQDRRIRAVAEFYGELPDVAAALIKRMPPVLILHGAADPIVPVEEGYKIERLLKSKGVPYEMKVYPGQGHGFKGDAAWDAALRTVSFFDSHLKS